MTLNSKLFYVAPCQYLFSPASCWKILKFTNERNGGLNNGGPRKSCRPDELVNNKRFNLSDKDIYDIQPVFK